MKKSLYTRRNFLRLSAMGFGAAVVSFGLSGCNSKSEASFSSVKADFLHGVASGDPLQDRVILWTRITPEQEGDIPVSWEVASDADFNHLVTTGTTITNAQRDYTIKVDATGLNSATHYYYRFKVGENTSSIGRTKTLAEGSLANLSLAVFSCSNFPAGHFHAYADAAKQTELDAVIHLGDYIYEYGRGGYASEQAADLGREVLPEGDLVTLNDYRQRYAQYHGDSDLQQLHATLPFIVVWDDHEVANDTWRNGAEAHDESIHGDFDSRRNGAMQAYFEWLPIRPASLNDVRTIYRSFEFGDLVALHMLDTRQIGRDKQLAYADYIDPQTGSIDQASFSADLSDPNRSLLGAEQLTWIQAELISNQATWQVLGQQVIMGKMLLPAAIATQQMSISEFAELAQLAHLVARYEADAPNLTNEELTYITANAMRLTPQVIALLQLPAIPYNLDAWDGYAYEREVLLSTAASSNRNLVVLTGDTHNSWANNLTNLQGEHIGVELAGTSVSSPGLEYYLGLSADNIAATEAGIKGLIADLQYCNLMDRGYMVVHFTPEQTHCEWHYTSSVKQAGYHLQSMRSASATITAGSNQLAMI